MSADSNESGVAPGVRPGSGKTPRVGASASVGILGGGQLGQMLAQAADRIGLETLILDPKPDAVASQVSRHLVADYEDPDALDEVARCDVVTYEFENIPTTALDRLVPRVPVRPPVAALAGSNDRMVEKDLFRSLGIATAPYEAVDSRSDLEAAAERMGFPAILKTRRFGYDGKGQRLLRSSADLDEAWAQLGDHALILEGFVDFDREVSGIAVRSRDGATKFWPLTENHHVDGILHVSRAPAANVSAELEARAHRSLEAVLSHLDYVGVLVVEFFQQGEGLVANEMACRVHNSGHWTIEGAETSQFENHLRAVAEQPLGSTDVRGYAAMLNLIGEIPDLSVLEDLANGPVRVETHVYGKSPAPARKLGHLTLIGSDRDAVEAALATVLDRVGDRAKSA